FPFHEEQARRKAGRVFERSFHPQGTARQHVAIVAHESIKPALASVTAPTLVIHGANDPLIPLECGKDTAESVPGAELLVIDGMGHNHPKEAWPQIVEAISNHARKAQS
ncbi:MAG: alpha/beta hydrolase, partial [Proteobacteria bacterium]|nr:alpha/beta hydrolase [Pseudomonadota bacterium]